MLKDHERKRGGGSRKRMAYARNAALAARERMDPATLMDYLIAVMKGESPVLEEYEEDDGETAFKIKVEKHGGIPPTLEQRLSALREYLNRGWGQPAQTIQLEAELRGQIQHTGQTLNVGALPASAFHALKRALESRAPSVIDTTSAPALPASTGDTSTGVDDSSDTEDSEDD